MQSLWTSADVASYLRIGQRKFAYLRSQGRMVPPIARLGKSLRFDQEEVRAWVRAGCPPAVEWDATKRRDGHRIFRTQNF